MSQLIVRVILFVVFLGCIAPSFGSQAEPNLIVVSSFEEMLQLGIVSQDVFANHIESTPDFVFKLPTVLLFLNSHEPEDLAQIYEPLDLKYADEFLAKIVSPKPSSEADDVLRELLSPETLKLHSQIGLFIPAQSSGKYDHNLMSLDSILSNNNPEEFRSWLVENLKFEFGAVNQHFSEVDLYWLNDQTGEEVVNFRNMQRQVPMWLRAFSGHEFIARDSSTQEEISRFTVYGDSVFVIKNEDLRTHCDLDSCHAQEWNNIRETPSERIWREGNSTQSMRVQANKRHPSMLPHFTEVGFKKMKIPYSAYEQLLRFYRHNWENMAVERWSPGSNFVNHRFTPTLMIHLPERGKFKQQIYDTLRPVLEEWSGISLIPTSFYGIRVYQDGSVLENHVDRASTHVISTIFHIDHVTDETWYLEIFDHAGEPHHIELAPGEMALYESATCIHGRPQNLHGKYYSNSFLHFKPVDSSLWPAKRDIL